MQPSQHTNNRSSFWQIPFKSTTDHQGALVHGPLLWVDSPPTQVADEVVTTGVAVVVCTQQRPDSLKRFLDSLAAQDRHADELIIVDASDNTETEEMLHRYPNIPSLAARNLYFRVSGSLKGITHQRNFALRWVTSDLVVFFDDDVELMPDCLSEMERVHREAAEPVAGVGAFMRNQAWPLADSWVWRARLRLKLVTDLRPGSYQRSGISIPWNLINSDGLIEGDWLPGCAMMWKTAIARSIGFYEGFGGYAQGEDLEFSLRARLYGKLLVSGAAQVIHFYESNGRPEPFNRGYMAVYNRYQIHRRGLLDRCWRDVVWLSYALAIDTVLLTRYAVAPSEWSTVLLHIAGRLKAVWDILFLRRKRPPEQQHEGPLGSKQRTVC